MDGVLIIDKPVGPTSHDVVGKLRKLLGTRAIGHAGTLDPLASGVLVIAIGQATKLVSFLTAHEKRYEATIAFGARTTTLDREGEIVEEGPLSEALISELRQLQALRDADATRPDHRGGAPEPRGPLMRALDLERNRREQVPPVFSAIKQGGRSVHKRARRGETVVLAPRPVELRDMAVVGATADTVQLSLRVAKGYYVRSLARDVGETVGTPAHLAALRRTASGPFTLDEASALTSSAEELRAAMQPLPCTARRVLPAAELTEAGVRKARFGQLLADADFVSPPTGAETWAWFDENGGLVAIGRGDTVAGFTVDRGFSQATSSDEI